MRVELSLLSPVAGFITATPVVVVFVIGLALGNDSGAVAMAIGANLIAIASLVGAPRLSLRLAVLDALLMGVSVFVGVITGPIGWLHLVLLIIWCFWAGMLETFGQTSATVGSQSVIAFVVLGRFSGSTTLALHLSGFVVFGSLVEVVALVILLFPPSLRYQRTRLAIALASLASLAAQDPENAATSTLQLLDDAEFVLNAPSIFGRTDARELRAIFDQMRRIRLEITTLSGLRVRLRLESSDDEHNISQIMALLSQSLLTLGFGLRQRYATTWAKNIEEYDAACFDFERKLQAGSDAAIISHQCVVHLRALSGQLRATGKLIDASASGANRRMWITRLPDVSGPDFKRIKNNATTLVENIRPSSPAFRHAIRLAVAVPLASLIGSALSLPRSFWLTFAVVVILKPDYSTLLLRGLSRIIGTIIGATVAALLVGGLHPSHSVTVVLVAIAAWIAYSTWSTSFAVSFGFVTAMVLLLISTTTTDTLSTALDRLLDFSLGGVIALVAYLLWPSSQETKVSTAMAQLFRALARYLDAVLNLVASRPMEPAHVTRLSRSLRMSWVRAESAVARSIDEPAYARVDVSQGRGLLAATMRILRALHALRIESEQGFSVAAFDELDNLRKSCVATLEQLATHFEDATFHADAIALRPLYKSVTDTLVRTNAPISLNVHLDELVNAINTATELTTTKDDSNAPQ